jgi:hypothetical protein
MSKKLPTSAVVARYGKTAKTLDRWVETGIIPRPKYINGYKFWEEVELDASDSARGQGAPRAPVAAGARISPKSTTEGSAVDRPQGSAAPPHPIASAEQRKRENAELFSEEREPAR